MGEVKRYAADRVPILWDDADGHFGKLQEVVLATVYDALLSDARRLWDALCKELETGRTVYFSESLVVLDATAYLKVTP